MSKFKLPDDLYNFQREDLNKLLSNEENWLLLSEMGTGKTPIALGLSTNYNKTLIVCPNTLRYEWARQISDWMGIEAAISRKSAYRKLDPLFNDMLGGPSCPFFVINYEAFRTARHLDILTKYPFDLIIMDEAHKLRNPSTKMTRGMFSFLKSKLGTRILILTGSPIINNPADLFTLLCIVKPDEYNLGFRNSFIKEYCYYYFGRYGLHVVGSRNLDKLREETADYTIRRTKKDVLQELPDKYYRKVLLEMDKKQRTVYEMMENDLNILLDSGEPLWAPSVLAQLTRLRQLNTAPVIIGVDAPSVKTDFLMSLIEDSDKKIVIYSCFETYIEYIDKLIKAPHILLTGKVPVDKRISEVARFQNDENVRYALGTIQTMGEGITLTAASDVVLIDRWWNPAICEQAVDRLHRVGQKNAVQVIIPVCSDSIDSSLDKILEEKKKYSSEYLGDNEIIKETIEDLRSSRR